VLRFMLRENYFNCNGSAIRFLPIYNMFSGPAQHARRSRWTCRKVPVLRPPAAAVRARVHNSAFLAPPGRRGAAPRPPAKWRRCRRCACRVEAALVPPHGWWPARVTPAVGHPAPFAVAAHDTAWRFCHVREQLVYLVLEMSR
jgi:hypothetical protein